MQSCDTEGRSPRAMPARAAGAVACWLLLTAATTTAWGQPVRNFPESDPDAEKTPASAPKALTDNTGGRPAPRVPVPPMPGMSAGPTTTSPPSAKDDGSPVPPVGKPASKSPAAAPKPKAPPPPPGQDKLFLKGQSRPFVGKVTADPTTESYTIDFGGGRKSDPIKFSDVDKFEPFVPETPRDPDPPVTPPTAKSADPGTTGGPDAKAPPGTSVPAHTTTAAGKTPTKAAPAAINEGATAGAAGAGSWGTGVDLRRLLQFGGLTAAVLGTIIALAAARASR